MAFEKVDANGDCGSRRDPTNGPHPEATYFFIMTYFFIIESQAFLKSASVHVFE